MQTSFALIGYCACTFFALPFTTFSPAKVSDNKMQFFTV